jgi:hypothetical protein
VYLKIDIEWTMMRVSSADKRLRVGDEMLNFWTLIKGTDEIVRPE